MPPGNNLLFMIKKSPLGCQEAHCIAADDPIRVCQQPSPDHIWTTKPSLSSASGSTTRSRMSPVSYSNRGQQRSTSAAKMPFTLPTLISGRANRSPSRSPTRSSSKRQQKLYFSPGGHTHDRHTIPPDRLHISLSDPVLVAAEERLANVPNEKRRSKRAIIREPTARTTHLGSVVFHFEGEILSQTLDDCIDDPCSTEAVGSSTIASSTQVTRLGHFWKAGFHGAAAQGPRLLDSSGDSCDIAQVATIMGAIDVSPGSADNSASDNRYLLMSKGFSRTDQ